MPVTQLSRRFAGAFLGNLAGRLLRVGEQLLLTPLYILAWGLDGYGAWLLLASGAAFAALANAGIGYAAAADIVILHARGDHEAVKRVFGTALCLITGAIAAAMLLTLAFVLAIDFGRPVLIGADAPAIVLLLAFAVLILFYIEPLAALLGAARGAGLPIQLQAAVRTVELLLVGLALFRGVSPLMVAVLLAATAAANVATHVWLVRRIVPWLGLSLGFVDRDVVKQNWRSALGFYGLFFSMNVINLQAPRLIVGLVAGPAMLSAFVVLVTYMRTARSLAAMIAQSIQVEIGRMAGRGDSDTLRHIGRAILTRSLIAAAVLVGAALCVAPWFIPLWTHGKVAVVWAIVAPLALVAMIGTLFDAELALASGLNQVGAIAVAYTAGSIVAILVGWGGAVWTGAPAAVAWAMLIPEITGVGAASQTLRPALSRPVAQ